MTQVHSEVIRRARGNLNLIAAVFSVVIVAHAQATVASDSAPAGRLDFDAAKLPSANVEVDLSQEMFKDLFGIGDAAIAGVAETLLKSATKGDGAQGVQLAAEQMEAARQIVQLAGNVVREVRVRAYESLPEGASDAQQLSKPFDEQLQAGKWETIIRIRDDENIMRVSVLRHEGVVQGIFVVGSDGENVVLANLVCDISPENVKKITAAATKIGLENGLGQAIEVKLKRTPGANKTHEGAVTRARTIVAAPTRPVPSVPPVPPTPPVAPKVSN